MEDNFGYDEDEDLYKRLGVPKEASVEEIRAAFHRQSLTWHPDKVDPKHREVAERKFKELKEAHNILSDEQKRHIYDKLGLQAVTSLSDRELAHYTSIDDLLKKLKMNKTEEEEQSEAAQVRGKVTIHDNFMDPFTGIPGWKPHMIGFGIEESVEKRIGKWSTLVAGVVFNKFFGGPGSGLGYLGLRRMLASDGSKSCYTQILYGENVSVLRVAATTKLTHNAVGTAMFDFASTGGTMRLAFHENVTDKLRVNADIACGEHNEVSFKVSHPLTLKDSNLKSNISAGIKFPFDMFRLNPLGWPALSLHFSRDMTKWDSLKCEVTTSFTGSVDYKRKINQDISLGFKTSVDLRRQQLDISIRGEYMDQAILIPFHWPPSEVAADALPLLTLPFIGAWFVAHFWLNPMKEREHKRKVAKIRETTAQKREEKRAEAMAEQDLMKYSYERKLAEETAKRGLVIKKALYGKLTDEILRKLKEDNATTATTTTTNEDEGEKNMEKEKGKEKSEEKDEEDKKEEEWDLIADVTIPMQHQVEASELHLLQSSKRSLKGFYDPCPGEKKTLYVEYTYGGALRRATYHDNDEVLLPSDAHIVKK